jgi:3-oxoacyl-[acyl-carrier protein] reductase
MKSVLITGATSGIGRAAAIKFAREGYLVYCHGKSSESDFSVIEEIEKLGERTKKVFADMANESEIRDMFAEIKSLDVLVNNAGTVTRTKPVTTEDFRKTMEVNVIAPYLCAELSREKGVQAIVNLGSMRALPQTATTPDYSASKAAVHNLTASLARMYAPECRVNAVAPGFTQTGMHTGNEERLEKEAEKSLLKIYAQPEDIAEMIYFLSSEKARFITGQVLVADGGRSFCEA